jgi:ABC-type hemin transport system substrate-binding protein
MTLFIVFYSILQNVGIGCYIILSSERIVSFLPSSTEILYEIGAGSQIVGVTQSVSILKMLKENRE